jgi:hypothetical protein
MRGETPTKDGKPDRMDIRTSNEALPKRSTLK